MSYDSWKLASPDDERSASNPDEQYKLPDGCCGYTSADGRCCSFPLNCLHGDEYRQRLETAIAGVSADSLMDAMTELALPAAPAEPELPRIITHHEYPPIPWRQFDWCAYREGREEEGGYGWGPTEEAAIADLLDNEEDE